MTETRSMCEHAWHWSVVAHTVAVIGLAMVPNQGSSDPGVELTVEWAEPAASPPASAATAMIADDGKGRPGRGESASQPQSPREVVEVFLKAAQEKNGPQAVACMTQKAQQVFELISQHLHAPVGWRFEITGFEIDGPKAMVFAHWFNPDAQAVLLLVNGPDGWRIKGLEVARDAQNESIDFENLFNPG